MAGGRIHHARARQSKAANLLRRLDEHRAEVLRFIDDFRVPGRAGHDVRPAYVHGHQPR